MITLARVFQDKMVLQRNIPISLWGQCDTETDVDVFLNGQLLCREHLPKGDFFISLPPQEAMEDAELQIGEVKLSHVDIGEVWVAGGQSNMEFFLKYEAHGPEEMKTNQDAHLRMYTVGRYCFKGQRELGYKAWNPWDCWYSCEDPEMDEFSAVAYYFGKKLRAQGIPVGILNCNWGGTRASAWLDPKRLENHRTLHTYIEDFEEYLQLVDQDRFEAVKNLIWPRVFGETQDRENPIMKNTYVPEELEKVTKKMQDEEVQKNQLDKLAGAPYTLEERSFWGLGSPGELGSLYENMLKEIAGYSVKGVLWYQGESDEIRPTLYSDLFSEMISCWRSIWQERNHGQTELPFLYVQLAPFGTWLISTGKEYPMLRKMQQQVEDTVLDAHMAVITDLGNVFDIHPKEKQIVGNRLFLLAEKYVYGQGGEADAPKAVIYEPTLEGGKIHFLHGEGLHKKEVSFESYNGFSKADIKAAGEEFLPPVLDGINGLRVVADGKELFHVFAYTQGSDLCLVSQELAEAKTVEIDFAQTGFYEVNLYNEAGLPVRPFQKKWSRELK